jgi:hypothetical protein
MIPLMSCRVRNCVVKADLRSLFHSLLQNITGNE